MSAEIIQFKPKSRPSTPPVASPVAAGGSGSLMAGTRRVYMSKNDFDNWLGVYEKGVECYSSLPDLTKNRPDVKVDGIVEVDVILVRTITEPKQ
jgi:hypothetical protein